MCRKEVQPGTARCFKWPCPWTYRSTAMPSRVPFSEIINRDYSTVQREKGAVRADPDVAAQCRQPEMGAGSLIRLKDKNGCNRFSWLLACAGHVFFYQSTYTTLLLQTPGVRLLHCKERK